MSELQALTLTIFLPDQPGRTCQLETDRRYTIGRSAEADIQLQHPGVSRLHLIIDTTGSAWQIIDQASKNGTRLAGRPIDRATIVQRSWLEVGSVAVLISPGNGSDNDHGMPGSTTFRSSHSSDWIACDNQQAAQDSLEQTLHNFCSIAGCERAGIWILGGNNRFEAIVQIGNKRPPPSTVAMRRAADSGSSVFCSDTDGAQALASSKSIIDGGIRALFAMPLQRLNHPGIIVYADSLQPGKLFTDRDTDLLESAVEQLALDLNLRRIRQEIRALQQEAL